MSFIIACGAVWLAHTIIRDAVRAALKEPK